MDAPHDRRTREGFFYGLAAYGTWGLVPLYFKALQEIPPPEILAHRIVWSLLVLAALLTCFRGWSVLGRCLIDPVKVGGFLFTGLLNALNWYSFIVAVEINELKQASLGYYITPLVSVVLGLTFLRERLRPGQVLALVTAAAGVGYLIWQTDQVPWISLVVAISFALYGLVRKQLKVDGLVGLSLEVSFLTPLAVGYLLWQQQAGELYFGRVSMGLDVLVMLAGVVTAVPLVCFGQAAQRLPLSALGFMQYLSPTIQMVLALTIFGEVTLPIEGLALVWIALAVFTVDSSWRLARRR